MQLPGFRSGGNFHRTNDFCLIPGNFRRGDGDPPREDMTGRFDDKMHMTVNACPFIPPALHFFGGNLHKNFHRIFVGGKGRYIINFSGIAGMVFAGFLPVDIKDTFAENPVKFQINFLFAADLRNGKRFAVFPGAVREI